MENIEMINGIPVDWSKYKGLTIGSNAARSKKSYVSFVELLHKNGHKLMSDYVNLSEKVLIKFDCEHTSHWIRISDYKKGVRCPKCANARRNKDAQHRAKEDFLKILNNNGHKLLSEYIDNSTKVLIDFNCGHKPHWTKPSSYKQGYGCPKCKGKCSEQAKEDLINMINDRGHELLSEYINNTTKVLIDFNCGHKPHWIQPSSYKQGRGCDKCGGTCSEQAKEDLINMISRNGHILLSEYKYATEKVLIDFNCGHKPHWIQPSKYKEGQGCPLCSKKGESALYGLLLDMNYEVEGQKKYDDLKHKSYLKYDFYLKEYNLLIELDGEHHRNIIDYSNNIEKAIKRLEYRKYVDKLKDEYAKSNNIPLLRIEYNSKIELDKWKQLILDKINEIKTKIV